MILRQHVIHHLAGLHAEVVCVEQGTEHISALRGRDAFGQPSGTRGVPDALKVTAQHRLCLHELCVVLQVVGKQGRLCTAIRRQLVHEQHPFYLGQGVLYGCDLFFEEGTRCDQRHSVSVVDDVTERFATQELVQWHHHQPAFAERVVQVGVFHAVGQEDRHMVSFFETQRDEQVTDASHVARKLGVGDRRLPSQPEVHLRFGVRDARQ